MKLLILILLTLTLYAKESLYLHTPSSLPSTNINTSFGKELVKLIKNAENEISFAIYGLRGQDDVLQALIEAQKREVKVKGVVDSDSHNQNYYSDTKELYKYFNIVSDHKSAIMHNKFFVIDKSILWSSSSNISDTGTGGYNANNALIINDENIASIYLQEFNQMFYDKKFHTQKTIVTYEDIQTENSIVSIYFSPKSNTYENGIKELVENAESYIYIPIFYLTHKGLAQKLIEAKDRGVEVKIILDATAAGNKYSMHKKLRKNGITVKVENFGGKMHIKSLIVDDTYIVSGSMNLTKAGNTKNDENTLVIKNTKLAKQYKKYFLELWTSIPNKYLFKRPNPESLESGKSCFDGIDNDFDKKTDLLDNICLNQ
jgi:phosphatidylserine/phosphatidylglycerophosphate/cardiolipin synthase-like enzyme